MKRPTFADRLETFGDQIAVIADSGDRLTYRQLAAAADQFAERLGADRRLLVIEAKNEVAPLVAYLGAMRHGHPVLLLSGAEDAQNQRILETYSPHSRFSKTANGWRLTVAGDGRGDLHPDLAVLLSTSGTTGAAKLVRLSHEAIESNARSICEYLSIYPSDRAISSLQFHYSYGLSVINSHLRSGATILLTNRSVIDPEFWELFRAERATSLAGVPYTYELLDRVGFYRMDVPSLKTLTQAGGRLAPDVVTKVGEWASDRGVAFFVMYGQTEATARMAYMPPDQVLRRPSSIGIPIPGGRFRLLDDRGNALDECGVVGELAYSGPNVMMGYAENFEDLARGHELSELLTGDLATKAEDGFYSITGRKSRFAKIYGLRLSLDEIESHLGREGIRAVVASDDEIIALAILGKQVPEGAVAKLSAKYSLPSSSFCAFALDDFPTLPSGKVDVQALLRRARSLRSSGGLQGGSRGVQAAFARAFANRSIDAEDSFVSLGGDSLNYVNLCLDLEDQLGFLPESWEELSVGELSSMAPKSSAPVRWWSWRAMDTEVLLRALAILAVVVNHASDFRVGGGAEALLFLYGYNLSRYQKARFFDGRGVEVVWSLIKRVIAPYYAILVLYLVFWKRDFDINSLALVSNFSGRFGSLLEPYWFLEAILQCSLILLLIFSVPPIRKWAERAPWAFAVALLTSSLLLKVGAGLWFDHDDLWGRTPDAVLYLLAFGWALHQAKTNSRKLSLTALALLISLLNLTPGQGWWPHFPYPSNITQTMWFLAAALSLLWMPRIYMPQLLRAGVSAVAAASFYIYLSHGVPVHIFRMVLGSDGVIAPLAVSVVLGVLVWRLVEYGAQRLSPQINSTTAS